MPRITAARAVTTLLLSKLVQSDGILSASANFATCRHIAYNLTRNAPGNDSIRLRRKTAGWDDEYLASLIAA